MKKPLFQIILTWAALLCLLVPLTAYGKGDQASGSDSWAIYIYLCGTDLETENGMATSNLAELLSIDAYHPNVNVYFQTGGAKQWQNDVIDPSVMQRYHVNSQQEDITLLDEGELTSMGDESTLADFLSWVAQDTSDKVGIIFWNHGGGALDGVEFDELFDNDALSLANLKNAFNTINPNGIPFLEFVGFDCCLMATIEIATIFAGHARYLVASEELEPGGGWDYTAWYSYLCENPGATGAELGIAICDSYDLKCKSSDQGDMITLSVIDLSYAMELFGGFYAVALSMRAGAFDDQAVNADIIRGVRSTERYGGDTESEGYSNLVDVGHMISNISHQLIDGGEHFLTALQNAVVYNVYGPYRSNSTGLSVFYPMNIDTTDQRWLENLYEYLTAFDNDEYTIYITGLWGIPYDTSGLMMSGREGALFEDDIDDDQAYDGDDAYDEDDHAGDEPQAGIEGAATSGGMTHAPDRMAVSISEKPYVNDEGYFAMTIDPATLDYVREVSFSLYVDLEDNVFCYLGSDNDLEVDWKTGYVEDNFRGVWPSIDGQYVTFDLVQSTNEYIIYSIPVKLNGKQTNLRVIWEWADPDAEDNYDGKFVIWGAWDGISSSGLASRDIKKLMDGDVIIPLMYGFSGDDPDNVVQVEGDPITVQGELKLVEAELEPADYWFRYSIEDLMGNFTYTDFAIITIDESGEVQIGEAA